MRRALKKAAVAVLGPYRFNRIYCLTSVIPAPTMPAGMLCRCLDGPPPAPMLDARLKERFWYGGEDAYGYGLFLNESLAAVCWFWGPRRFNDPLLWTLEPGEAILVDLMTASNCRGQGLAPLLIRYASAEMHRMGWNRLYTWMWYTHRASYHAFQKAGWEQVASVLEIAPFGSGRMLRFCWRSRANRCTQRP
jgi:GNAT superfamily N-acetyltransferase